MRFYIAFISLFFSSLAIADDGGSNAGFFARLWAYLDKLFQAIEKFIKWCIDVVIEVFKSLFTLLTDLILWNLKTLLSLASSLLSSLAEQFDISGLTSQLSSLWGMVPIEAQQIMQAIGVPTALGIVVTGILIRFGLQLIPFIRLGS